MLFSRKGIKKPCVYVTPRLFCSGENTSRNAPSAPPAVRQKRHQETLRAGHALCLAKLKEFTHAVQQRRHQETLRVRPALWFLPTRGCTHAVPPLSRRVHPCFSSTHADRQQMASSDPPSTSYPVCRIEVISHMLTEEVSGDPPRMSPPAVFNIGRKGVKRPSVLVTHPFFELKTSTHVVRQRKHQ